MSPSKLLDSSDLPFNISINELKDSIGMVSVLENKLLIFSSKLYILQLEPCILSTVSLPHRQIYDITWTPHGNILYTTRDSGKVVLVTALGKLVDETISKINMFEDPRHLSVTYSVIYLANFQKGFYKSSDGGKSWTFLFKPQDGWNGELIIKVVGENTIDFWAIEMSLKPPMHLLRIL